MIPRLVSVSLLLVACGGGGDDGPSADAAVVPAMINVSGVASEISISGRTPIAGVVIEAYREGDDTVVSTATTNAAGMYTMPIATGGVALDGYLLAKHAPHKDTYLYPPGPLAADTNAATVLLVTPGIWDAAATLAGADQTPGHGWIGVMVLDAANVPVAGVTVTSSPAGVVRYNGVNDLPSKDATVTHTDGIAYIFEVKAGTVMVNATKSGATFKGHPVNARVDQITTTLVQ